MLTFESNAANVAEALGAKPTKIGKRVLEGLRDVGITLQNYLQKDLLSGQLLGVRTGQGRRSIFWRVEGDDTNGEMSVVVGADLTVAKYMRIQNDGGTITAKGKLLTIPLPAALTGNGVARFTAANLRENPTAYGYIGSFVRNGIIFGKLDGKEIVPLFVLRQSVTIQGVGYLGRAYTDKIDWVRDRLAAAAGQGANE
jgi:hypothetical protein